MIFCSDVVLPLIFFSKLDLAYNHLNDRVKKGQVYEDAWNATSVELVEIAELHGRIIIIETFYNTVRDLKSITSNELWTVLKQLLQLYAVYTTMRCSGHLLRVSDATKDIMFHTFIYVKFTQSLIGVKELK